MHDNIKTEYVIPKHYLYCNYKAYVFGMMSSSLLSTFVKFNNYATRNKISMNIFASPLTLKICKLIYKS